MHISSFKIGLAVFFSGALHCGFAQATDENYANLSLNQAIDIALKNNIEQHISLQAAAIAESQYQEARSARWPTISLQGAATHLNNDPSFTYPETQVPIGAISAPLSAALSTALGSAVTVPSTITVPQQEIKMLDRDTAIASLQMLLPLYTGGKISSIIEQADLGKKIAQEEYQRTSLQTVRDVKRYYYAAKLTHGLSQLAQDTVDSLEVTRDLTKSMYEAGADKVNKLDYLKTEMAVNYAKSLQTEFAGKEQSAMAALINTMGISWGSKITLAESDFPDTRNQPALENLISQAAQFNPQMNQIKLAVQLGDARIDEAKSAYYPQIAFTGSVNHVENSFDGGVVNRNNVDSWTIGVAVNMTLFDFGKTSNHVNTEKLKRESISQKQILVEQGLAAQIKNLFILLDTANKQKNLAEKSSGFSQDYERLTGQSYQIGGAEPADMIQASILNAVVQGGWLRAKYDAAYSLAEIEYYIGAELQ